MEKGGYTMSDAKTKTEFDAMAWIREVLPYLEYFADRGKGIHSAFYKHLDALIARAKPEEVRE
jgi:hypothetical protein